MRPETFYSPTGKPVPLRRVLRNIKSINIDGCEISLREFDRQVQAAKRMKPGHPIFNPYILKWETLKVVEWQHYDYRDYWRRKRRRLPVIWDEPVFITAETGSAVYDLREAEGNLGGEIFLPGEEGTFLIFLDIDGVLNWWEWFKARGPEPSAALAHNISKDGVKALNKWLHRLGTNMSVVISSSWRHGTPLREFQRVLGEYGLEIPVVGITPSVIPHDHAKWPNNRYERGLEIQGWVEGNVLPEARKHLRIIILDDDRDMGVLLPYLVQTKMQTGILPVTQHFPFWKIWEEPEVPVLGNEKEFALHELRKYF